MKRILFGIGRAIGATGRATVALVGICGVVAALANYAATQGVGTNFGSIVVSTVHYAQQLICDSVTPAQCVSVSAGGAAKVDGSAVTQPVSAASLPLPTGAATAANQSTEITALNSIVTNTGAAVPSGTARIGYTSDDPCTQKAKTNLPISQNGTSSVQLIALSGATVIYVCSLSLIAAGATTVALTTGTGSACVTGNAAVIGSTTANIANSLSFAANGGLTLGNGAGTIAQGAASSELCMINGSNVFVSGNLTYVQQ